MSVFYFPIAIFTVYVHSIGLSKLIPLQTNDIVKLAVKRHIYRF